MDPFRDALNDLSDSEVWDLYESLCEELGLETWQCDPFRFLPDETEPLLAIAALCHYQLHDPWEE